MFYVSYIPIKLREKERKDKELKGRKRTEKDKRAACEENVGHYINPLLFSFANTTSSY